MFCQNLHKFLLIYRHLHWIVETNNLVCVCMCAENGEPFEGFVNLNFDHQRFPDSNFIFHGFLIWFAQLSNKCLIANVCQPIYNCFFFSVHFFLPPNLKFLKFEFCSNRFSKTSFAIHNCFDFEYFANQLSNITFVAIDIIYICLHLRSMSKNVQFLFLKCCIRYYCSILPFSESRND